MTQTWSLERQRLLVAAYALAAFAGPVLYASSQVVSERLHPTATSWRTLPVLIPIPAQAPAKRPSKECDSCVAYRQDELPSVQACAAIKSDAVRLSCYDKRHEVTSQGAIAAGRPDEHRFIFDLDGLKRVQ